MRDYDPTLGRYLQADPLGLVDGASVYDYALQNPGRYTDPKGEFIPIAIGFAIGAGLDLLQQLQNNGNSLQCVNWLRTGGAGAFGAFTGGFASGLLKGLGGIHRYKNWSSASRAFKSPSNLVGKGYETHHGIAAANGIRNTATWRNHFMNLRNLPKATHRRIHGKWQGADQFTPVGRWFYGTPEWLLGAEASAGVGALIEGLDGSCDCAN